MKRLPVSILIYLLLANLAVAQDMYQPGYLINLNGDSLRGYVKYKRWDRNPTIIYFKNSETSDALPYKPITIKGFSVAGEHYESAIVDVDGSPYKVGDLTSTPDPEYVRDTVFLQSLFLGEKKLLFLKDRKAKEHFYIIIEGMHKPLVFKKYMGYVRQLSLDRRMIIENTEYKKQLFFYLNNCPQIQPVIEDSKYQTGSMTRLFKRYHECIGKPASYVNDRRAFEVNAGIVSGVSITTLKIQASQDLSHFGNGTYEASIKPTLGFFLDLHLLRSRGMKITNDFFYSSFALKDDGSPGTYGSVSVETSSSFNFSYLKTQHMIQVGFLRNGLLYLAAGATIGIVLKNDIRVKITYPSGTSTDLPFPTRKYEYGVLGGIGSNIGRFNAEVRYERSTGFSDFLGVSAKPERVYVVLKYILF